MDELLTPEEKVFAQRDFIKAWKARTGQILHIPLEGELRETCLLKAQLAKCRKALLATIGTSQPDKAKKYIKELEAEIRELKVHGDRPELKEFTAWAIDTRSTEGHGLLGRYFFTHNIPPSSEGCVAALFKTRAIARQYCKKGLRIIHLQLGSLELLRSK